MSNLPPGIAMAAALLLTGIDTPGAAEEGPRVVRSADVIALTMAHNPDLQTAILSEHRAQATIQAAEGLYPFVLEADTGYTHSSTPLGQSLYHRRDNIALGAGLSKTLSVGTSADFRLEGDWTDTAASRQSTGDTVAGNPSWGFGARLTLTQPLLRGFGNRVGLSSLRQAQKEKRLAEKRSAVSASTLAAAVLSAYWDLWLAAQTVDINARSRDVAKAQLQETTDRVNLGDAAPVDKLSYQTRLAALEETVIESEAELRRLQIQLAAKAGLIEDHLVLAPDTEEPLPFPGNPPPLNALIKQALSASPDIKEAFAAVVAAEERAEVAGESMRQRLDLTGWIEARTLGADELSPVVTDLGQGQAYSGYIGLVYELPLDNRRKQGERAQALIDIEIALQQLKRTEHQVRADVAAAHDALLTAQKRLTMAEETLALAKAQAEADRERYRLGAAIFTEVRDAEEAVREAELRRTRAKVDAVKADITLNHLTGALLQGLAF